MGQLTSDATESRRVEKKWRVCRVQQRKEHAEGELAVLLVPASVDTCLQDTGFPPPSSELPDPGQAPLLPRSQHFSLVQRVTV